MEPTESQIKNQICQYLELIGVFFWIQSAGKIPGRINRSRFIRNGVSDILGVIYGRMLAIEVKKPGGRASKEQMEFIANVNAEGGIAFLAYSLEDVISKLKAISPVEQSA